MRSCDSKEESLDMQHLTNFSDLGFFDASHRLLRPQGTVSGFRFWDSYLGFNLCRNFTGVSVCQSENW